MAPKCPTVVMYNEVEMPLLGCRTFFVDSDNSKLRELLRTALEVGYRLIDTAHFYQNEAIIGDVLQEFYDAGKLRREDVFITTKLSMFSNQETNVAPLFEEQLKALHTDYIDLYLFHLPVSHKIDSDTDPIAKGPSAPGQLCEDEVPLLETWHAMEALYETGKVKAIGLSNFDLSQIETIFNNAKIKPHNVQTEVHVLWPQEELLDYCQKNSITVTTYAPFGAPGHPDELDIFDSPDGAVFDHDHVISIASKHNKSPAQVLLKQLIQRGISVIPKCITQENVKQSFDIFDFELDVDDMGKLDDIGPPIKLFKNTFGVHPINKIPEWKPVY